MGFADESTVLEIVPVICPETAIFDDAMSV
jgi:hypothetical protein